MKYAFVNGAKQEPEPKQEGVCCLCNNSVLSKCGTRKVWHWAHKSLKSCDSWWENETPWHRLWKSYFSKENQEVVHFEENTGEKHIADIKTDDGMVIEIQNSPMNFDELSARENFYQNMVWIVNGKNFEKNFAILDKLPEPYHQLFNDIVFRGYSNHSNFSDFKKYGKTIYRGDYFHKKSENPEYEKCLISYQKFNCMVQIHFAGEIEQEIEKAYAGHHLFCWKKSRDVWYQATKPVYIDFGGICLWWLKKYYLEDYRDLWCLQKVSKEEFVIKNNGKFPKIP
ncbi:hypothetical protein CAL7716_101220 (plasmid) [Calothrix sp. PCC 7716]|nr:hypothetical protein CAL7716_101220 [Calothrix sp. PCC 7716]